MEFDLVFAVLPFRPGALQIPSAEIVLEEKQRRKAELRGKRPLKGRAEKATHCNTTWRNNVSRSRTVLLIVCLTLKETKIFSKNL